MKKIKIAAIAACSTLALFACDQGLSSGVRNDAPSIAVERSAREIDNFYYITVDDDQFCTIEFNNGHKVTGSIVLYYVEDAKLTLAMYKEISFIRWRHALDKVGIKYEYKKAAWYNPFGFHEIYISADQLRRKY